MFGYIPAPAFDSISFIQIYGITMALGMIVGVVIANIRYRKKNPDSTVVIDMFLPTVISGIAGARIYHLFTGYDWERNGISGIFNLRAGGLSIWGAVIAGALALYVQARMKKVSFYEIGAAVIPGLAIAQAIGRVGNYFNQELFGKPLDAPWALYVDSQYRPLGYQMYETFHPTFLYEALWCIAIAGAVIVIEKKVDNFSNVSTILLYVFLYCLGRIYFEWLRIDDATVLFGVRFNLLLSAILVVISGFFLIKNIIGKQKMHNNKAQH